MASDFNEVVTAGVEEVGVDDCADFGRDFEEGGLSVHDDGVRVRCDVSGDDFQQNKQRTTTKATVNNVETKFECIKLTARGNYFFTTTLNASGSHRLLRHGSD